MQAWKYTLPAFIVPFMFCLTPDGAQLLMLVPAGTNAAGATIYGLPSGLMPWLSVLWVTITACLALVGLCVMFTGYALQRASWAERILCLIGGGLLLAPSAYADAAGLVFLGAGLALHWFRVRTAGAAPPLRDTA
jgi:TRAP-type uncharacterized transport system fused permease subunit